MSITDHFNSRVVSSILAIMLLGGFAAQGEETNVPSVAIDTNLPAVAPTNATPVPALPAEVESNSAYDELVRLVQAGVDQSVISTYIENSLRLFNLDADKIIYLTDLGAPSGIIEAAMEHDSQLLQNGISPAVERLPEVAEPTTNQPPEVTVDDFYNTLAPYGTWIYVEGYGQCWQPTVVVYNSGWRPYCDNGRWVYTDCGWYWISDYSWGWAAFHYGRWFHHVRYGWCWWPDTVWSPSWVCWRYDRDYCGWAPLPPYTSFRYGAGIVYRGSRVSVGFNFGLDADCYTFVATRYFCDPKPRQYCVDRQNAQRLYDRTKVFNRLDYDVRRQRMVNEGISPTIVSTLSSQSIEPVSVRYAGNRPGNTGRHEQLNRDTRTLVVSRPNHAVGSQQRASNGLQHPAAPQQRTSAATDRGTLYPDRTTKRLPEGRVQHANPSGPRQPMPAPQARQQRSTAPPVSANVMPPDVRRTPPPQNTRSGKTVPPGNPSVDTDTRRPQTTSGTANQNASPGKSNHSMRSNRPSGHSRPNVAENGQ